MLKWTLLGMGGIVAVAAFSLRAENILQESVVLGLWTLASLLVVGFAIVNAIERSSKERAAEAERIATAIEALSKPPRGVSSAKAPDEELSGYVALSKLLRGTSTVALFGPAGGRTDLDAPAGAVAALAEVSEPLRAIVIGGELTEGLISEAHRRRIPIVVGDSMGAISGAYPGIRIATAQSYS